MIYGANVLGQTLGMLLGALVGVAIAGSIGCDASGQGWMSGYTCESGFYYLGMIGALIGMPAGTAAGIGVLAASYDLRGDDVAGAMGGGAVGWLPTVLAAPLYLGTQQLSITVLFMWLVGGGLSPLISAAFFDDDLDRRTAMSIRPYVATRGDGAVAGLRGRF